MALERETDEASVLDPFRQVFALEGDVIVLSLAMLAFSLSFQMTSRYVPEFEAYAGET